MRGSIRKRGNTYQYRFHIDDQETGKRREISKGGFKTKKEAQSALTQAMAEVENQGYTKPSKITLSHFAQEYMESRVIPNLRPSTIENYRAALIHINKCIGNVKMESLNAMHINKFMKYLQDNGYKPSTITTYINCFKPILKTAREWNVIKQDLSVVLKRPKVTQELKHWSFEECMDFLEKIEGNTHYMIYLLTIFTGLRRGEVLGLPEKNLNFTDNTIVVSQQLTGGNPPKIDRILKSDTSSRIIDVPSDIMSQLKKHIFEQKKYFLKSGIKNEHNLVFTTRKGLPIHPSTLSACFKQLCNKHGLRSIPFHGLRHSHATILAELNENVQVIADRLGHSSPTITNEIYIHLTNKMKSSAITKLNNIYEQAFKQNG